LFCALVGAFDITSTSQLLASALLPIRSKLEVKRHKLTKAEQSQFTLSADLKNILVGLILGFDFLFKRK
jgi:hypothetical protein